MSSTSQPSGVVVWEWEERPSLWIPYQVDVGQFLEDSYLMQQSGKSPRKSYKGQSTVNLGKCNSSLNCYEVDLGSMEQLRLETGKESSTFV